MYAVRQKLNSILFDPINIAPLAVFRIAFGTIMFLSTGRFILKGWVKTFYIKPIFHFTFYGFEWVKPLGADGMYVIFGLLTIASLFIVIGLFYKLAISIFFIGFTYVELIDKTFYLNHYYLVSVLAFLMILVPAGRFFSIDVKRKPNKLITYVPAWCVNIFKLQLLLVYFFAGISKINPDWLLAAMPLRIWLPANSHLPVIGGLLTQIWVAFAFSWFGMLFDLLIGFLLLNAKIRKPAYFLVVVFHLSTSLLFNIGAFPYIMIFVTIIFFSEKTHSKIIERLSHLIKAKTVNETNSNEGILTISKFQSKLIVAILTIHFCFQLLLPLRYLLYPGKLYWTEEGYRFSWRVMLMEKGGTAFFYIKDQKTGGKTEVNISEYLTALQEKMMVTQPDMILEFAHFLSDKYKEKGIENPVVTANSFVTLNGNGSRLYIDSTVNLAKETESFDHKKWILPFKN